MYFDRTRIGPRISLDIKEALKDDKELIRKLLS
jgi:hypothetical protein